MRSGQNPPCETLANTSYVLDFSPECHWYFYYIFTRNHSYYFAISINLPAEFHVWYQQDLDTVCRLHSKYTVPQWWSVMSNINSHSSSVQHTTRQRLLQHFTLNILQKIHCPKRPNGTLPSYKVVWSFFRAERWGQSTASWQQIVKESQKKVWKPRLFFHMAPLFTPLSGLTIYSSHV